MGIEPDRPYYCLDCGKTFTRKEHLLRHRRSHTGETPYPCAGTCGNPDCSKQFARKEHLKRHTRVHTGENPYPCNECGRSFGRRERLLKHLKSHGVGDQSMPPPRKPQRKEFKKEPGTEPSDPLSMPSHGVFGDQNPVHLLNMIARKGPLTPEQLGMHVPPPNPDIFTHPDVKQALANPDVVRAFQNPQIVKAFALSSPQKRPQFSQPPPATAGPHPPPAPPISQPQPVSRGPDLANTANVPPELSKLPPGFSIFPVVPSSAADKTQPAAVVQMNGGGGEQQQAAAVPGPGSNYYQAAGPSHLPHKPGEITLPMSWAGWPMQGVRGSPAKIEPDSGYAAAYFRSPFS